MSVFGDQSISVIIFLFDVEYLTSCPGLSLTYSTTLYLYIPLIHTLGWFIFDTRSVDSGINLKATINQSHNSFSIFNIVT